MTLSPLPRAARQRMELLLGWLLLPMTALADSVVVFNEIHYHPPGGDRKSVV